MKTEIKNDGFRWCDDKKVWVKEHETIEEYYRIREKYEDIGGIKIKLLNSCYSRNSLYRKAFLKSITAFSAY